MTNLTNTTNESDLNKLFKTVVGGGYCVGCGACASVDNSPIKMKLDDFSKLQPTIDDSIDFNLESGSYQSVCPFSDESDNEDTIGKNLFGLNAVHHEKLGYYLATYAGHVTEGTFRDSGSSGGMGSWIASTLFKQGLVDGVIHIHQRVPTADDNRLFHYQLSSTMDEIRNGAKSRYYPIELSEMVKLIKERPGKYLFVGIPCFIKSIRLLSQQDEVLKERIKFCIGLICGHLKTARFAEMLAWQCDIPPQQLTSIDFRTKLPEYGANKYGVTVTGMVDNLQVSRISPPVNRMYGTNWGLGFFKYKACDYCDDVVAETADVTIGDAWLPQYLKDSQGTNVVIIRNIEIQGIINQAIQEGELKMDSITPDDVIESQKSGFEHRREGLAYRLFLTDQKNEWRPNKRFQPENIKSKKIQEKQKSRIMLAEKSHIAFKAAFDKGQFSQFTELMNPLVQNYEKLYKQSIGQRMYNLTRRILKKLNIL